MHSNEILQLKYTLIQLMLISIKHFIFCLCLVSLDHYNHEENVQCVPTTCDDNLSQESTSQQVYSNPHFSHQISYPAIKFKEMRSPRVFTNKMFLQSVSYERKLSLFISKFSLRRFTSWVDNVIMVLSGIQFQTNDIIMARSSLVTDRCIPVFGLDTVISLLSLRKMSSFQSHQYTLGE